MEGCCIAVLNKKGLENLIIDIAEVQEVEVATEFLILRFMDRPGLGEKVIGVYIHPDKEDTREVNSMMVRERWEALRKTNGSSSASNGKESSQDSGGQFVGRQLNVNQLFNQQSMR
jgi:hypothetical protein